MEEAIVKKIKGIIAVKSKFKNISPNGFITYIFTKTRPSILPAVIPQRSQIILL
jgi:hypothetical protein